MFIVRVNAIVFVEAEAAVSVTRGDYYDDVLIVSVQVHLRTVVHRDDGSGLDKHRILIQGVCSFIFAAAFQH